MAIGVLKGTSTTLQDTYGLLAGIYPSRGEPPKRGTNELLNAYSTMPWLRAVTNKVGRSVASTDWRLYVASANGKAIRAVKAQRGSPEERRKAMSALQKAGQLRELEAHPFLDMLATANDMMTGLVARQLTQIWLDLVGEAFWIKERNKAGMPVGFWPIPPSWVVNTATPTHPFFEVAFRGWRGEIPASEIVWFCDPDPANPYGRGSGTAKALGDELETDEYAAKHVKTWFYNNARPDLIISGDGLQRTDTQRLEEDWLSKHQGFWKAYKPHFINRKIDIHELSQNFQNMQLVDLRKNERDTIIQVYGSPPEIFGVINNSNRATIEAADYLFARWVLVPRLELQRDVLQERLVPDFDERLILDYVSPVAEDKEYQLKAAQAAPWAQTVDEWRAMQGLEPLPNEKGKVFMVPFNLVATSDLRGNSPPSAPAPPGQTPPPKSARHKDLQEGDIEAILAALRIEDLLSRLQPAYREIVVAYGDEVLATLEVGISFDLSNPRVIAFLEDEAANKVTLINDTTREALRTTLSEGVANGENIPKLAKRISEVMEEAKGNRAVVIARTEVVGASNFGTLEGMRQGGVPQKEWLATPDDRTRDSHAEADGQIVGVDEPFTLGSGVQTQYPGGSGVAEEDIQCRCTVAPVINGKSALDTVEKRRAAWNKYDSSLRPWERRFESEVKKGFQAQQDALMRALKELGRAE